MKNNRKFETIFGLGTCVAALAIATPSHAAPVDYHITVNTAPLVGNAAGPFSLDFQLNDGSGAGDANNAARIQGFQFGGGNAFGIPNLIGGATGDLGSGVTLKDTDPLLNEFFQTFTPGSTLEFDLFLTSNSDAGLTPDAFSFSILDQNLLNIPTTGIADSLLFVNLNTGKLVPETGASIMPEGLTVTVPDGSGFLDSIALAVVGLAGFGFCTRSQVSKLQGLFGRL